MDILEKLRQEIVWESEGNAVLSAAATEIEGLRSEFGNLTLAMMEARRKIRHLEGQVEKLRKRLRLADAALRSESALSPMDYPPDADDGSEDERIWHSERHEPD